MARIFGLISVLFFISHFSYSNCRDIVSTFNTSADTVCGSGPHRIVLTNTSTGTNSSTAGYFWYRNGTQIANTVGTSSGVTDSIFSNGVYTYMIVGFDSLGVCADTFYKSVIAVQQPVADFTFPIGQLCPNSVIQFTNSSGNTNLNTSYSWNFGDGSVSKNQNPSHLYGSSGNYNVRLTVGNSSSCTSQITKAVTIAPTPSISISGDDGTGSTSNCLTVGDTTSRYTITFTNNSASGVNYTWDFDDGSPLINQNYSGTSGTLVHTFTSYGTFMVVCSAVAPNGCLYTDTIQVDFSKSTSSSFTIPSSEIQGCAPHSVTPINGSVNATIYIWNFGNGTLDSNQNPTTVFTSAGTFPVSLQVVSDSGCSDMITKTILISAKPLVDINFSPACVGDTVYFTENCSIAMPDSIVNWFWEFGDGNTSTLKNPSHVYLLNNGSYQVKLTVTSSLGCASDSSFTVSLLPVPNFNYGPEKFAYCEKEAVQFYDSSTIALPSTIVGWEWYFRDGFNSFSQNPVHTYDSAGNYRIKVRITSSDGCVYYDSLPAPLIIYPNPVANFTPVPSVLSVFRPETYLENYSSGATNWTWDFGDSTTGFGFNPTHLFPNVVGVYPVTQFAYSDFGCVDSITKNIVVKDEYTLYVPNSFTPEKEFNRGFKVHGHEIKNFSIKIFNRWGELVYESVYFNKSWDGTHKGEKCPSGVYVYQIIASDPQGNNYKKSGFINLLR